MIHKLKKNPKTIQNTPINKKIILSTTWRMGGEVETKIYKIIKNNRKITKITRGGRPAQKTNSHEKNLNKTKIGNITRKIKTLKQHIKNFILPKMEQQQIDFMKQYLQELKLPEDITHKQKRYLQKQAHKFTIYKDNLYRYNTDNGIIRKVLNKQEAEEIMYSYHQHPLGGHLAYNNTLHKIASRYYWENMTKDIMEYVKKCHRCQRHGKKSLKEELYPVPVSVKPFDRIALDVKHVQWVKKL